MQMKPKGGKRPEELEVLDKVQKHTRDSILDRLNPLQNYDPQIHPAKGLRRSAVLIPILTKDRGRLLFTLRSSHLKHHAGQVSFPGGGIESEETPWEAALREAHEEIGLRPEWVAPLGRVDDVFSPRGFHVCCYVGLARPFEPCLNPNEVAQVLEVDLDELFDESLHETRPWKHRREIHFFHFKAGLVWGVTGQIVYRLREVLRG